MLCVYGTHCDSIPFSLLQKVTDIDAPGILINGFYTKGTISSTYNIDGSNGRTTLRGRFVVVANSSGTVVGCTGALA